MHRFETSDSKEARRFRVAQFNGRSMGFTLDGIEVFGAVRTITERMSNGTKLWTITMIRDKPAIRRLDSRVRPVFPAMHDSVDALTSDWIGISNRSM
jgi:hypothetical protein